jgi:hypothetical protein
MSTRPRSTLFAFPNPVNEVAARTVAGGVVLLSLLTIATRWWVLLVPLAYGFVARLACGPRFSPLGLFATKVVGPRLPPKLVPGPPKRFAQGIGAVLTTLAAVLHFGFGADGAVLAILTIMVVFATLESVFALCVGCKVFGVLMRVGVIPASVCEECNDLARRVSPAR